MCFEKDEFVNMKERNQEFLKLAAEHCGADIKGLWATKLTLSNSHCCSVKLENTLYIPNLRTKLISVSKVTEREFKVVF